MPKVSIDYSKTNIYKLVNFYDLNDENIYVGYCTNIVQRRYNHRTACCKPDNRDYNLKVYQFIRENGGWDQWEMILIEKYPCDDVDQARARERYWKKELNATLNTNEPGRTQKEWREDNKEILAEKEKQYRKDNKQIIAEKNKDNYQNNKEKINEKRKEKITCECGGVCSDRNISRHRKSNKHQEWLKNNNLIN